MSALLRPARPTDAGSAGDILWRCHRAAPWLADEPSGAETIAFCGAMIARGWMTVAVLDGRVCGFLARDGQEICALYTAPDMAGRGIGAQLLDGAKREADRLHLWTAQVNAGARRFYRREGFVETARSDGRHNDAALPDVTLRWKRGGAP